MPCPGSPVLDYLNEVDRHTRQAVNVVQQLLSYSGKSYREVGTADLSQLVRGLDKLLVRATATKAELRFELATAPIPVEIDASQVSQVVMNLVTNGAEAVTAGRGTVTVRTRSARADRSALTSPYLEGNELPEGDYAVLEVTDTGSGMSAECGPACSIRSSRRSSPGAVWVGRGTRHRSRPPGDDPCA